MPFPLRSAAVLMTGACGALPLAHAQDASSLSTVNVTAQAEKPASRDYRPVVSNVGGKTALAIEDIPQTVTVVNQALMQAQGATSLADALRNVPGITIGGAEGGQIGNNINLRGFTARTDIYLDGFRDRGQYYRDTFDLEQIEVLQGPSSMLFGRGSTGGVINQVTKKAEAKNFAEVEALGGTDGRWRSTADTNFKIADNAGLRLNAFAQDQRTTRSVLQNRDYGFSPTLSYGIDQPTQVTLYGLVQHNHDMPDYGVQSLNGHPVSASSTADYGLSSDRTIQDVAMFNGLASHKFGNGIEIRNQFQYNQYGTNARESAAHALASTPTAAGVLATPAFGNYNPQGLWVEMQSHDREINDTSVDDQLDLIAKFHTGFLQHDWVSGVEVDRDSYRNQSYSRTGAGLASGMAGFINLENPSETVFNNVKTKAGNLARSSADELGGYFNDTISFAQYWKVTGGLRYDDYAAHVINTTSSPTYGGANSHFLSKRLGLIFQPSGQQSYYVSYGTSFDPLLEQLTLTNGTQHLPPTNTRSYEVGGKFQLLHDKLLLTAAAFDERENNVYSNFNGEYTAQGNWHIRGTTLGVSGHITDKLQISSGYMFLDPKVLNTTDGTAGSIPANTAKNTFNLWSTYDIASQWEVGGGPTYMSRRYVADSSGNVDRITVPSYMRWDATAAFHQPRYDIRLNLLNLGNKHYYDALIPSDGGRSVPGIGRTLLISVSYKIL